MSEPRPEVTAVDPSADDACADDAADVAAGRGLLPTGDRPLMR